MDISKMIPHIEKISSKVHDAWWEEKKKQGFHSPLSCEYSNHAKFNKNCDKCHTDMYPYNELPENVKEYDRVTVNCVVNAIGKI